MYCSTRDNAIQSGMFEASGRAIAPMNGAGIYLGCDIQSGISRFNNLSGPIFVTGRRASDGRPLTSDALWGILNFIWDAMDLYGTGEDPTPTLLRWVRRYRERSWVPMGGDGGVDVYCVNVSQSRDPVETIAGAPADSGRP
jgi:hypothetical protein